MNPEALTRQYDLIPLEVLGEPITIIGSGAVGSWVALMAAKMGLGNITVFDHDKVEVENMNCQLFGFKHIGMNKAEALSQIVDEFTGFKITANPRRYEYGTFAGIVVAAVDSMQVRRAIWEAHKAEAHRTKLVIDPRMGSESALLYVMDPSRGQDAQSYEKSLYGDSEALQEPCTAKATGYTAGMLAGLVVKAIKDRLTRPDYLRTAQWNIRENEFMAWRINQGVNNAAQV